MTVYYLYFSEMFIAMKEQLKSSNNQENQHIELLCMIFIGIRLWTIFLSILTINDDESL